ncbi:hypothetical protein ACFVMC_12215 [Nocardia sp. NPDC127579]|uniref:hypothetical protein n=1 Tax=Nocardia sp. NPDC127579 TaxID=3345402 RepID=UPI003628D6FB
MASDEALQLPNHAGEQPGMPPERQAFCLAVRALLKGAGLSIRGAAAQLYVSKTTLWEITSGKRKRAPDEKLIKQLHDLAVIHAIPGSIIEWEELHGLLLELNPDSDLHPPACACGAVTPQKPASQPPSAVVPVPQPKEDRHNQNLPRPAWSAVHDLARYIASGTWEHANGLMRHVGVDAPPGETALAIASARELDLHDAAETIISYAGRRSTGDVLTILHSLKSHGLRDDADTLLEHALTNRVKV